MLSLIFDKGTKRELPTAYRMIVNTLSISIAIYLMIAVLTYPESLLLRSVSLGIFFAIIFITYATPGSKNINHVPFYDLVLAFASIVVCIYIVANLDRLIYRYVFVDQVYAADIFFGVLTIILLLEGTRRIVGPWLPALTLMALVYIVYGHQIPGRFGHPGFTVQYIIDGLFLSPYGIFGSILGTAVSQIMIFLIFGSFFVNSGAGDFLFDLVSTIAGKSKGGIAKVAVISSALFGMISGSPISNVATTGALTIPAMKKRGYSPEFAAAAESCASVGGILMPPIMGSMAFIMADIIGMPYSEVAKRAFLPAVIYFAALFFTIDIRSRKLANNDIFRTEMKAIMPLIMKGAGFFIPLFFLVYRLMEGVTTARVGLESILVILVISFFTNRSRVNTESVFNALITSISRGSMIIAAMATCSILVGVINITGITAKFSSYLMAISSFSLLATLILVMMITLFLGLAMNMTSAYLITAVICAPALILRGYEPLSVHLFILFYATMGTITPPVALTAFAAAAIAEASPMRVGFMSMKMALVAYILPYVFIFNPAILLSGTVLQIAVAFLSALCGVGLIALGMEGWWNARQVNLFYRGGAVVAGVFAVVGIWHFAIISSAIIAFIYLAFSFPKRSKAHGSMMDTLD